MKNFSRILIATSFLSVVFLNTASSAFAQTPSNQTFQTNPANRSGADGGIGSNDPQNSGFQLVPCDGVQKYLKDANGRDTRTLDPNSKECTYKHLVAMVSRIITFVLYILIPIVLGMIIFIGFKYLTANGDSTKLADAKRMIKPLLLGIFLIFAAWLIVYTFLGKILAEDVSGIPKTDIVPRGIR
jgi:hypothetical protein